MSQLKSTTRGEYNVDSQSIISVIDAEISTLQQVRDLLATGAGLADVRRTGRAKKGAAKKAMKRTMSPEARQRIADAQRKRWATAKKVNTVAPPKATETAGSKKAVKRTMSPEARQRIADAQRKRWASAKKLNSAPSTKATKKAAKKAAPKKAANAVPAVVMPEAPKAAAAS
jgi:hypothetical protein